MKVSYLGPLGRPLSMDARKEKTLGEFESCPVHNSQNDERLFVLYIPPILFHPGIDPVDNRVQRPWGEIYG
jgi:hypothetical protein